MSPDPAKIKRDSSLDEAEFTINQLEDEEMEVDVEQNLGYLPLNGSDLNEVANDSTDEEDDDEEEEENEYTFQEAQQEPPSNIPSIIPTSAELQAHVWNSPRNSQQVSGIELTNETSQQITQIMSKISLPNAPAWINEISTETLINRLKQHPDTLKNDCKN